MLEHEPHAQRKGAIQATAISRSSVTHMNMQRYSVSQKRKFYIVFFSSENESKRNALLRWKILAQTYD